MSSSRSAGSWAVFALLMLSMGAHLRAASAAEPDDADRAAAQEMFAAGMEAREKGDHKTALGKFKLAFKLVPSPITALELGREYAAAGKLVEARERFLDASRMPSKASESAAAKAARAEAERLGKAILPRIPMIIVNVSGAASATVTVDDVELPQHTLGSPHRVNPGSHRIVAKASGAPDQEEKFTVKEGETKAVDVAFPPTMADEASTRSSPQAPSPLVYVGFGIGGVGLVTGVVATIVWWDKGALCRDPPPLEPDQKLNCANGPAKGIATVSFVVAGVGAGIGLYGLLSAPGRKSQAAARVSPWIGWGTAGIEGVF